MPKGTISSWIVLILAGIRESVWATALGKSQGFTEIVPYIVFIVGLILSIPSSTAYAVWVGIGAALTVLYAIARGVEACWDDPRQKTHPPAGIKLLNPT
ncbi:multidrug efflux SMR transporter [uncultured Bifidobacterium sp.]|uniref:DMT family transporter n=1 Tax=uncultured Bifidobacterium sp. TaxID=165187 RepID=UPI0025D8E0A8|nr:SMR family transporter [uncultured Bifidobacterium sp.]